MKLRGYQERARREAITALRGGGGFLLTLEMRTGKTPVSLAVAQHYNPSTLLIVCPKVAVPVWKKHVKKFGLDRALIIHYEGLYRPERSIKQWYKWADEHKGFFMIVDEAHFIKDRGSTRSRVVRTIAKRAKYRLALTGTPIAQGLEDAWAIYDYLGRIFGPWDDKWIGGLDGYLKPGFESKFLLYGGFKNKQIVGYRNKKKFYRIFHEHQFRITLREAKEEGGKGNMILRYRKRYVEMKPETMEVYGMLEETLETEVNKKKIRVPNVLACVAKLQQIAGGFFIEKVIKRKPDGQPRYTKKGKPLYKKTVHKMPFAEKLLDLLFAIEDIKGKFIVICRFIHELEAAKDALEFAGYKTAIVRGGMPYDGEFKTDAICMQIQSGMAVDMSKADTIVFYSLDYSYINFEQSRFRILNYDKSFGKYIFLLAKDTVDEVIYAAIKSKKRVADLVIDKYRIRGAHDRQLAEANRRPEVKDQGQTRSRYQRWRRLRQTRRQESG